MMADSPWILRTVMIVFGLLLAACAFLPWGPGWYVLYWLGMLPTKP